ncbi:unnamed protein product [Prunus armeniaca]|uniref:GCK domain-containing protein n=2 Tax=Prunus armeniaca TaxID=36596 RepID=A0A6J5X9R0_PRUAR|nr:unnamed protein product [Prunus armeniaca]
MLLNLHVEGSLAAMGAIWSSDTSPDSLSSDSTIPTDSHKVDSPPDSSNPNMSNSDSKTPDDQTPKHTVDHQLDTKTLEEKKHQEDEGALEKEEEQEEGECGFCLFMKAGGCRESFIAWEKCAAESEMNEEDVAEKCFEVTAALKKCMQAHPDHYAPILRLEKAAEEETVKDSLEEEKASKSSEQNATLIHSNQHGNSSEKRDS